ncbi:LysR family transcriptional regulator [Tissierella sp. MSJ-40]|uniref:LysR family transcriptional regulator n=1 Tax=Tissierella simiarum TaxID=2841534 RepID=A0ABS6E4R7_9FIRM|nr:LysR family transcriptional regulator [Tissierella simiarum]MBU5437910.1 LysR family transcriptional regulator [Tissierella simiarum]
MTIRHLRIFIEVADSGKMSIAASKLFISQPTVSQAIRELEEHYNVILFERLCKRLHITPEGKKLLSYARNVVKQYDDLEEKMLAINDIDKIYIGATITVGNCLLSNIINKVRENSPKLEPYAYINNTSVIEEKLLRSELDIALVEGKITNSNLICIPAVDDYLVLVCSKDHIFSKRKEVSLDDLADMDFVMREKGSGTRKLFEDYMLDNGVNIRTRWETNCPGTMKSAVIEHQCLGVLSVRLVEEEIKNGIMHVIRNPEFKWERNFSIVYHKDKIIDEGMKDVIEVISNYKEIDILEKLY